MHDITCSGPSLKVGPFPSPLSIEKTDRFSTLFGRKAGLVREQFRDCWPKTVKIPGVHMIERILRLVTDAIGQFSKWDGPKINGQWCFSEGPRFGFPSIFKVDQDGFTRDAGKVFLIREHILGGCLHSTATGGCASFVSKVSILLTDTAHDGWPLTFIISRWMFFLCHRGLLDSYQHGTCWMAA